MIFSVSNNGMVQDGTKYAVIEVAHYTVYYSGIFQYASFNANKDSIFAFCAAWRLGDRSFDELRGSYHIVLVDAQLQEAYVFTDNAGTQCFYVDRESGYVSTSFLSLLEMVPAKTPDCEAIADYIQYGCIYSTKTFVKEIVRSSPDCYYYVKNGELQEREKKLVPLSNMTGNSLDGWIKDVVNKTKDFNAAAIITGGVDSRMVLANLIAANAQIDLVISGEKEHIDARIAKEIAQILNRELSIVQGRIQSLDDFHEAYRGLDGIGDCITLFRLTRLRHYLNDNHYDALWGGVSGELYKNSFLNQDFPCYMGDPDFNRFYKMKVQMSKLPFACFGAEIRREMENAKCRLTEEWIQNQHDGTRSRAYFNVGYAIMQRRMIAISNAHSGGVVHIAPLQERENAAIPYHIRPMHLEMQAFARNQVSRACPSIAAVKTDRGLSCRNGKVAILSETVKNYTKLLTIAIRKRFRRNATLKTEGISTWPFMASLINETMLICKENKLIKPETCVSDLSDMLLERLIVVGSALKWPKE